MKLTISYAEAISLIRSHFNLSGEIAVEIVLPRAHPDAPAGDYTKPGVCHPYFNLISRIDTHLESTNKIAAIRDYREASGASLRGSKQIIEDWANQRRKIITESYLPDDI